MNCPTCGGPMGWESDAMLNEIDESVPENDGAVVRYYSCQNCGTIVEASEPSDEEKVHYPYWNK